MYIDFHSALVLTVKSGSVRAQGLRERDHTYQLTMSSFFKQSSGGSREEKRRREEVSTTRYFYFGNKESF